MNTHTNIEKIRDLSHHELNELWATYFKNKKPPKIKSILLRELAWHLQKHTCFGNDLETQKHIDITMKQLIYDPNNKLAVELKSRPAQPHFQQTHDLFDTIHNNQSKLIYAVQS